MRLRILVVIFAIVSSLSGLNETAAACDLAAKDAPSFSGIRLGMTKEEFYKFFSIESETALFSEKEEKDPSESLLIFLYSPSMAELLKYKIPKGFGAFHYIQVGVFENKVYKIGISRTKYTAHYRSAEEFARHISGEYGLPTSGWNYEHEPLGILTCKDFEMKLNHEILFSELTDTSVSKKLLKIN